MNEADTRAELIDPALSAAGWGHVDGSRIRREHPITDGQKLGNGRRGRRLIADYLLIYNNKILAVVEAKARNEYYTDGVGQAKLYAGMLHSRFTYSTNGERIYSIDMDTGQEGEIKSFPSPDELWELANPIPNDWRDRFLEIPFEDRSGTWSPRYYQENAITAVLDAIANKQKRVLLTMATGTGKTAIAFQISWRLFHSKWNLSALGDNYHSRQPRILFLADRNILANQAFNSFGAFEEEALVRISPDDIRKKGRVPKNGSIFFTIFQTFMSGPEDTPYFGEYPEDFFDFIIIDECHRGGANDESSWRAIMDYFSPAVQLGLTATPKRDVNSDTYDYFNEPVYEYSLKEGINDGFLTPFRVKEISTTGDTYQYVDDDIVLFGEIDESREYTHADQNRIIEIMEIERYRVEQFMRMVNQSQKTLVFCATQPHAAAVRDLINQTASSINPLYCCRVTADDGKIGEQHLKFFQDNERTIPTILTTSRKLSTGVDARNIRNIVLLRQINSMVEFKQIVGRGTRLWDDKDYFTIYDFVNAHEHFNDPAWDGPPLPPTITDPPDGPTTCTKCGEQPCICVKKDPETCVECGLIDCICEQEGPRKMIRVQLSANRVAELDSMVKTSFWSQDGKPISATEFVKRLFGDLPELFKDEQQLTKLWSLPVTRKKLLTELEERGYTSDQLEDLRKLVHGENSDLFDVLAFVAFQTKLLPRLERASMVRIHMNSYNPAQQEFLDFVLQQYVNTGVNELDDEKLPDLLELKYHAIADAKSVLGEISSIRHIFIDFQKHLYQNEAS